MGDKNVMAAAAVETIENKDVGSIETVTEASETDKGAETVDSTEETKVAGVSDETENPTGEKKSKKKKKPKVKRGKLAKREARMGYVFVAPWIVGVLLFTLIPLAESFYYMWYNIRITPKGYKFTYVGTGNFTQIWFEDPEFPQQLVTYIWQTIVEVPIIVVFALMIAIMLNGKIHMRGFFRLIFFLPVIIVSGPVMNMLVSEGAATIPAMNVQSIVNAFDRIFPTAVAESIGDMFSNMIMILWYSGVQILIFLSALQKIDPSLYEAAKIDGGSDWECFWKITLPTIKPMILLTAIYSVIFLSSNEQNELINMIKTAMFSGTKEKGYGYASAMAWMYAIIISLITLLFYILLGSKKDVYDRQIKRYKKQQKKELRMQKRVEKRSKRNAKKIAKATASNKYRTYDGSGDY